MEFYRDSHFSDVFNDIIYPSASTEIPRCKSKVNKNGAALVEVMGVWKGGIYLMPALNLFTTITLSLLNVTAMDDWSDVCDLLSSQCLAYTFIMLYATVQRHS